MVVFPPLSSSLPSTNTTLPTQLKPTPISLFIISPILVSQPFPLTNVHILQTWSKSGIFKPINLTFHAYTSTSTNYVSYTEACKFPHWRATMASKFNALQEKGTWSLVPKSPDINVVGCKWVFRTKYNVDGSVDQYKTHLVAKGYHQIEGFNFSEMFSLVVKKPTSRVFLILFHGSHDPYIKWM